VFNQNPQKMFEHLSTVAARNYIGGNALRFGAPRDTMPSSFKEAVDHLCRALGEGSGSRGGPTSGAKDDGLDLVAWRSFPDTLPGKVILFGQCAAGGDAFDKTGELKPHAFCDQWMRTHPVSGVIRAFFVPHRVEPQHWEKHNRDAGIIFDRCRVAYWVHRNDTLPDATIYSAWARQALKKLR
jgi:hypothetical protein